MLDPNQPLDEGDKRIDKDRIIKLILSNSGEIITNIHSEEFQKTENVVCISDGPSKSYIVSFLFHLWSFFFVCFYMNFNYIVIHQ